MTFQTPDGWSRKSFQNDLTFQGNWSLEACDIRFTVKSHKKSCVKTMHLSIFRKLEKAIVVQSPKRLKLIS